MFSVFTFSGRVGSTYVRKYLEKYYGFHLHECNTRSFELEIANFIDDTIICNNIAAGKGLVPVFLPIKCLMKLYTGNETKFSKIFDQSRLYFIYRSNPMEQAASFYIAEQSKIFHNLGKDIFPSQINKILSFDDICSHLDQIIREETFLLSVKNQPYWATFQHVSTEEIFNEDPGALERFLSEFVKTKPNAKIELTRKNITTGKVNLDNRQHELTNAFINFRKSFVNAPSNV